MATVPAEVPPFSCSTNLSKEVLSHLRTARLTGRAWEVASHMHNLSFGNAGWRRQQGGSELSCTFDLAEWGRELKMNRSQLQRILKRLAGASILFFEAIPDQPGRAKLTWNDTFDWGVYDQRRNPAQAKNLSTYAEKKQPNNLSILADDTQEIAPNNLSVLAVERTKKSKVVCSDAVPHVLPLAPNKSTEEEITEENIDYVYAPDGASAPDPVENEQEDEREDKDQDVQDVYLEVKTLLLEKQAKESALMEQLKDVSLARFQRRPLEFALAGTRQSIAELQEQLSHSHQERRTPARSRLQEEEATPAPAPQQASVESDEIVYDEAPAPADDEADQGTPEAFSIWTAQPELPKVQWDHQLFASLCDAFSLSEPFDGDTRGLLNKVVKKLRENGILPDQIVALMHAYHRTFKDAALTPPALAKQAYRLKPMLA